MSHVHLSNGQIIIYCYKQPEFKKCVNNNNVVEAVIDDMHPRPFINYISIKNSNSRGVGL